MRHVQLIAISGSIGSAVFISIGNPLTSAGPLGLLIGLGIWCTVVWAASNCLIEMTTLLPCDGGFLQYATRFVDPSFGMALGWNVSGIGVVDASCHVEILGSNTISVRYHSMGPHLLRHHR